MLSWNAANPVSHFFARSSETEVVDDGGEVEAVLRVGLPLVDGPSDALVCSADVLFLPLDPLFGPS